jgi:AcrR family transcriptional regulator
MPKVSDAYRESRRDEIAQAAMRRLSAQGFANTSMADISAESGLSAGAIYSHFASKAEIARHVASLVMDRKAAELTAHAAAAGRPLAPAEVVTFMLSTIERDGVSKALLLQLWAESTVDPELHTMITETVQQLRSAYSSLVREWLASTGRAADAAAVRDAASAMLKLSQGYIAYSAIFGDGDPAAYLATVGELLG